MNLLRQRGLVNLLAYVTLCGSAAAFELTIDAPDDLDGSLRAASLLEALTEGDPNGTDVLSAAQADYARIVSLLYDQGYFAPQVSVTLDGREAASFSVIAPPPQSVRAVIRVDPGPKFTFGQTRIAPISGQGEPVPGFASGEVAGLTVIRSAVAAEISGWREAGHAKAEVRSQQITAQHRSQTLDVGVTIAPGPKLRFGDLQISGDSRVKPKRVRQIAGLPEGEVFSPDELAQVTERLRRTGTFRVVSLTEAEEIGPDGTLDIGVQLSDLPLRRFGFGAEVSSLEGVTLSAYWLHRNLLGGAERLRFDGEISGLGGGTDSFNDAGDGVDLTLSAELTRPATFGRKSDLYAVLSYEDLDEANYTSRSISGEIGVRRYHTPEITLSYGIGFEVADTEDAFGERDYVILTAPISVELDYRDNELSALSGYYLSAEITPFAAIEGTESGARLYADGRVYRTFGEARPITLALRGQIGALAGPEIDNLPSDFAFYSGGGGTVRGQSYQSLGVALDDDTTVGGRSFLGIAAELRVAATDSLSIVGFYDTGYIGAEEFPDGSSGEWHAGAGLGLRYDTGIGPIRLDVAVPVSGPGDNEGVEIYIGIGQAF